MTVAGFATLFGPLARLQTLAAWHVALSDQSAAALAKQPQLTGLNLAGSGLTDVGLMSLAAAPRLRQLNIRGGKVTPAGPISPRPEWRSPTMVPTGLRPFSGRA